MKNNIIYKLTNKINGKCYIGQTTKGIDHRIKEHIKCSKKIKKSMPISMAISKYGFNNFDVKILCYNIPIDILDTCEFNAIIREKTLSPNGYNLKAISNTRRIFSDETRKKLRDGKIGSKNPFYGKKHSNEFVEKIKLIHTNKITSLETREKQRKAQLGEKSHMFGKKHSEEIKEKMRKNNKKPMLGKKHKESSIEKISKSKITANKAPKSENTLKGVYFRKRDGKYEVSYKKKYIGRFDNKTDAAKAYDELLIYEYGVDNCKTNKCLGLVSY